jgi:hypothetical protein
MKTINLPPYAPILMESTRAIGYSLESAISDIIDNSISAQATLITIKFFPIGQPYISILDNGNGMSSKELNIAMQYGSKNPNEKRDTNDLGRFGLGLKTASLSQCRTLTVISLKDGKLSGRRWNLDYVIKTGKWSLILIDKDEMGEMPLFNELIKCGKGTLVIWQNLDRLSAGDSNFVTTFGLKMDIVREHIALVFHRFLSGEQGLKKIDITINNNAIKAADPFLIKKSTQLMDEERILVHGQIITVKPYILPHISKLTEAEVKELGAKSL